MMSEKDEKLYAKEVPDMLVASIRFRGHRQDLWDNYNRLREQIKTCIVGQPLCLHHGGNTQDGFDMEICFPVSLTPGSKTVPIRMLEGGEMICTRHNGPYGVPGEKNSLSHSWKEFYDALAARSIGLAEGPPREVYLEGEREHGQEVQKYVTELQEYLLLPRWLEKMARGLDRLAGEEIRHQVMTGCEGLTDFSSAQEKVRWVQQTMKRLDAMVPEKAAKEIMAGCAHVFPEERIQQLRAEYKHLGDIDSLLEIMDQDRSLAGSSYYSSSRRKGNIILTAKSPQNPKGYAEAHDEVDKRAHYCHCPVIKSAIRAGETISPTFCYCGSGWFQRLWSGILDQPVQVEVISTILQGDKNCTFGIHLPPGSAILKKTPRS